MFLQQAVPRDDRGAYYRTNRGDQVRRMYARPLHGAASRRLRRAPAPRYVLSTTYPVTAEMAAIVKQRWRAAGRRNEPLVVNGAVFTVQEVR